MQRFHAHIAVENIDASIDFYSKLFGLAPAKRQADYAKWILEDPPVNFAISARGHAPGLNHFGFQVDTLEELAALKKLAEAASPRNVLDQGAAACCYAKSEKHWTMDPQGLAWEHFHTMSDAPEFGQDTASQMGACCIPLRASRQDAPSDQAACCAPAGGAANNGACCG